MPRVREIEEPGGDPVLTQIFEQERAVFGGLLNPTKVMAHCPPILRAAKLLGASIEQSGQLPKALLSLVNFRVASINGCPFWIDINSVRVMEGDEGEAKLQAAANWRDSVLFSAEERLALDYAERMTITGQRIDDALFAGLRARFSEAQIVELTAAVALENFRSKFNPALGIEAQGFCLLPERWEVMPGAVRRETLGERGALGAPLGNPSVLSVGDHSNVWTPISRAFGPPQLTEPDRRSRG